MTQARWAAIVLAVVSILLMFVGMWAEAEPTAPPAPPTFSAPERMTLTPKGNP